MTIFVKRVKNKVKIYTCFSFILLKKKHKITKTQVPTNWNCIFCRIKRIKLVQQR